MANVLENGVGVVDKDKSGPFTFGSWENSIGLGGINGMLDPGGIFQPPPNPATGAMPYLNQIGNMLPQYFNSYMNMGQWAAPQLQQQYDMMLKGGGALQGQYGSMINDPSGVMNKIGAGYQQSPGFKFQTDQALGAANRAAAAGGMLGTPMEQQGIAGTVNNLANQDYYNYLNHALSMYSQGLGGMQGMYNTGINGLNNMYNTGYNASKSLGEDLANTLNSQAQLAYSGQSDVNQGRFGMLGSMGGAIGGIVGALL